MTADAYLKAMFQAASDSEPVDWNALDRVIDTARIVVVTPLRVEETRPMSINHPLQSEIENAQDMIQRIEEAAIDLADAISTEKYAKQAAADAKSTLAGAEAEIITEAVVAALAGEGPLANIAKTSKAYDAAIEAIRQRAYRNGLFGLLENANRRQSDALKASVALEQAQVRFSALKHAGELQAAILKAALL